MKYSRSNLGNKEVDLQWKIAKKRRKKNKKKHFRWFFSCLDFWVSWVGFFGANPDWLTYPRQFGFALILHNFIDILHISTKRGKFLYYNGIFRLYPRPPFAWEFGNITGVKFSEVCHPMSIKRILNRKDSLWCVGKRSRRIMYVQEAATRFI